MIEDPIQLSPFGSNSWGSLRMRLRGGQLFAISDDGGALYLVDITDDGTYRHHFMISSKFLVRDNGIVRSDLKREDFLDLMLKNYPDHAEWLLFHTEWLR